MVRLLKMAIACGGTGLLYFSFKKQQVPNPTGPPYSILPSVNYSQNPNKHFLTKTPSSIGIIGTGVSGLATAKELLTQGYNVEVLEKNSGVGGNWFENYDNAGLQANRVLYDYPDFAFPKDADMYPKLPVIRKFLEDYSNRFKVTDHISFDTNVTKIHQKEDGTWTVETNKGVKNYDFLVLCTGLFHIPNIPKFQNIDKFKGKIFHSSQIYSFEQICSDKKVVVIGGERSARDMSYNAYKFAKETYLVMKNVHYHVDESLTLLGKPHVFFISNRISSLFAPPMDNNDSSFIFTYLKPLCRLFYKVVRYKESSLPKEIHMNFDCANYYPLRISMRTPEFVEAVRSKEINVINAAPEHFTEKGIVVGGKEIEADVVILGTGFKRNFLGLEKGNEEMWMYRNMIVPGKKNLAVIGMISNALIPTYACLQAAWLADVIRGTVKLPSEDKMKEDINIRKKRFNNVFGNYQLQPFCIIQSHPHFDMLLKDMGLQFKRKESVWKEWIEPVFPGDYKTILTHRV